MRPHLVAKHKYNFLDLVVVHTYVSYADLRAVAWRTLSCTSLGPRSCICAWLLSEVSLYFSSKVSLFLWMSSIFLLTRLISAKKEFYTFFLFTFAESIYDARF